MSEKRNSPASVASQIGVITVLGAAIGTALGAALGNLSAGVAVGAALGLGLGIALEWRRRNQNKAP